MIGRLRGLLVAKHPPFVVLEVHGVGYELEAPMSTFYDLPDLGQEVLLHTHLAVRDDVQVLYGFAHEVERRLFRTLIRITGVGAKMALAVLSGMDSTTFARCIHERDTAALSRLPGIGRKTADRLIVELIDRLDDFQATPSDGRSGQLTVSLQPSPVDEALTALEALGYRSQEAKRMVSVVQGEDLSSEEIIRKALQATMQR